MAPNSVKTGLAGDTDRSQPPRPPRSTISRGRPMHLITIIEAAIIILLVAAVLGTLTVAS